MEKKGHLRSETKEASGHFRRVYKITSKGRNALEGAKEKVRELFGELFEVK